MWKSVLTKRAALISKRFLSTSSYHGIADSTLESICGGFERLIDSNPDIDADLGQGVLTVKVPAAGTYVINKQPPVKQIWLASPVSGPKKFDYNEATKKWVNQRDNKIDLIDLLRAETLNSTGLDAVFDDID